MYTELFFDDYRLLGRAGTTRDYGKPECIAVYRDPNYSTDYFSPWVFRLNGEIVMLYLGVERRLGTFALLAARSADGVSFQPLLRGGSNRIMDLAPGEEPACIVEDVLAPAEERYKMILTKYDKERFQVRATVYASCDLMNWTVFLEEIPDWGCEPVGGAFYNAARQCYTILRRPTWGNRCTGYCDTKDFKSYTPYELCLHQDAFDRPMDELYGMSAFPYAGMYIGIPLLYTDNPPSRKTKFDSGSIVPQLAYSWDGHHFLRSLRKSFLPDYDGTEMLLWLNSALQQEDGNLLLYCAMSPEGHGAAFRSHQNGRIHIYRLRKDGFIALNSGVNEATVTTREYLYEGGEISVNLRAERATMALIDTCGENPASQAWGTDVCAPGFEHNDCVPFSGDSPCWHPVFSGGSYEKFKGRVLILEIKYTNGSLYSVSGSLKPLTNTQSARYRSLGILAEY